MLKSVRPLSVAVKRAREKRTEFYRFQKRVHRDTWARHDNILRWADQCLSQQTELEAEDRYTRTDDPVVRQGYALKKKVEAEFRNKHVDWSDVRILIQRQNYEQSIGGYSLFGNLAMSLQFMGINVTTVSTREEFAGSLNEFRPTVLLTSDDDRDRSVIDWNMFERFRLENNCALGLTASLEEFGNAPLVGRLRWARSHNVNFYYCFSPQEYLRARAEYSPFWEEGYKILSLEFGANVLKYYPVPDITRDLDYVFLGSRNKVKWDRYVTFFDRIGREYPGFVHGGGWLKLKDQSINTDRDRYFYARARICLNLHTRHEIQWPLECNERSYMLAACGAPMLIDNPARLKSIFPDGSVFSASSPDEYFELFRFMLANPQEVQRRTLLAQSEIMNKYNTFTRAEGFVTHLKRQVDQVGSL